VVTSVDVPAGWLLLDPASVSTIDGTSGYYTNMEMQKILDPSPLSTQDPLDHYALRSSGSSFDLTAANPLLNITFHTHDAMDSDIDLWSGGDALQSVPGPVPIPEPGSVAATMALAAAFALRRVRGPC